MGLPGDRAPSAWRCRCADARGAGTPGRAARAAVFPWIGSHRSIPGGPSHLRWLLRLQRRQPLDQPADARPDTHAARVWRRLPWHFTESGLLILASSLSILAGDRSKAGAGLLSAFLPGVSPMMHAFWRRGAASAHQRDGQLLHEHGASRRRIDGGRASGAVAVESTARPGRCCGSLRHTFPVPTAAAAGAHGPADPFTCVVMWGRPSGVLQRTDLQG